MPTYVGSNTQFLSIPMITFNLRGQGNSCKVEVEPPISFFEGDLFINQKYSQTIRVNKITQGVVKYKLNLEQVNKETFNVTLKTQNMTLADRNDVIEGVIKDNFIDVEVTVESSETGSSRAYFYIEIEDGPPVSFSC